MNTIYYAEVECDEFSQKNLIFKLSNGANIQVSFGFKLKNDTIEGYMDITELED